MNRKSFCSYLRPCDLKYPAAGLLTFLLTCVAAGSYSQSFFYFENRVQVSSSASLTYYTFLTLQNNGTGEARIRYIDPESGEKKLIQVSLLDSADVGRGIDDADHYLIQDGDALPVVAANLAGFYSPRFLFKKQQEGANIFYVPASVAYHLPDGAWTSSEMPVNEQKSISGLRQEADLLRIFYHETDDMYAYIMDENIGTAQRGNLPRRKEKLYLISIANTLDPYIGRTTRIDMNHIVDTFTKLAADMNMEIQVEKIMDQGFSIKSVEAALAGVRPSSSDILIFYFSGHGFRYTDDKSLYPRMSMRLGEDADLGRNNLSLEAVYKMLLKKKARVTLCLSDCCNSDAGMNAPVGPGLIIPKDPGDYKPQVNAYLVKQLFFPEKPVSILVGSADKYQVAVGNPELGGYFTHAFTTQLYNVLYGFGRNATWLGLLASARKQGSWLSLSAPCKNDGPCVNNRRLQTARFEVAN